MARNVTCTESHETPDRDEIVSFIVVCRPQGVDNLDEYREKLELETLDQCLPKPGTLPYVADQLTALGFDVVLQPESPDVPTRGTVDRFEAVFKTKLVKMVRTYKRGQSTFKQEWFAVRDGAPETSVVAINQDFFITLTPTHLYS